MPKLPGKPLPQGDTQINKNGLIQDVRASQKYNKTIGQAVLQLIQFLCVIISGLGGQETNSLCQQECLFTTRVIQKMGPVRASQVHPGIKEGSPVLVLQSEAETQS